VRLGALVFLGIGRIATSHLKGDWHMVVEHARNVAMLIHNDVIQGIVAVQELVKFPGIPDQNIDRILIVKLDRIGDMVCTTPVFDALRSLFPKARLDIVGHPVPLSLLEGDERIGRRIPYRCWLYHDLPIRFPGPKAWLLALRLLRERYPLVVYLRGSLPFCLLGFTSRVTATKFVPGEPTIIRYMKPLESLYGPIKHPEPHLHVTPQALQAAKGLLDTRSNVEEPAIAIHAAASAATKMWPAERYAALADELVKVFHAKVHFFGSPAERPIMQQICTLSTHAHAYHHSLPLQHAVAAIASCNLFIGNDSGLAHVAAAVETPMVVLWGPANLDMARPNAHADRCLIIRHDLPCRPACPEVYCTNPVQIECLLKIQIDEVIEAAGRLLRHPPDRQGHPFPRKAENNETTCSKST
jgi:ADP-heptose:LPS heptosyltransferase